MLAQVTTIAGELGVNIEDLEIVHSPDLPRGVLILTVATDAADRVRHALGEHGYGTSGPAGRRPVIAIDGPAGAGKSTVATAVARQLGLEHLDTGAMYRAVTLAALERGVDPHDAEQCAALARTMDMRVGERVLLDGRDVTEEIRDPGGDGDGLDRRRPSAGARGARRPPASMGGGQRRGSRRRPRHRQRRAARGGPEGLPHRRHRRAGVASGEGGRGRAAGIAATAEAMRRRDWLDSNRDVSPLLAAKGAIVVDSTGRSVESVVEEVLSHL